ncbi:MAG: hypothetical protein JWP97_3381 [Labilithrix sp.]|nr:hypothetical protein [Labilithrix sp.]
MWVRGAAIRPVPAYAVVDRAELDRIEQELADQELAEPSSFTPSALLGNGPASSGRPELDDAFSRFERTQPALSQLAAHTLTRPLDETALALGYFLTIAVWLSFERSFKGRLGEVTEQDLEATESALTLEEELRASHAEEPLDLDDVMAIEQPGILAFVNEHVEAALEPAEGAEHREVDVDDVHAVYRSILVLTLALSHAVAPAAGARPREMLA